MLRRDPLERKGAIDIGLEKLANSDLPHPLVASVVAHTGSVLSLDASPIAPWLASGGSDGLVRLWDLSGQQPQLLCSLTGHVDRVCSVAFAPDGKHLVSGGGRRDRSLNLWWIGPAGTNAVLLSARELTTPWWLKGVTFEPRGFRLAVPGAGKVSVQLWQLTGTNLIPGLELFGIHEGISALTFSPDGRYLACAIGSGHRRNHDGTIQLWDVQGLTPVRTALVQKHHGDVNAIVFLSNGDHMVSAGADFSVRIWDVQEGDLVEAAVLHGHGEPIAALTALPDAPRVISADSSGRIILWDLQQRREEQRWELSGAVSSLDMVGNGRHLAVGLRDGRVSFLRLPGPDQ